MARYDLEATDFNTHKPTALRKQAYFSEKKNLVRYRDGVVVATKGEKFLKYDHLKEQRRGIYDHKKGVVTMDQHTGDKYS